MTRTMRAIAQEYRRYPLDYQAARFRARQARHVNRLRLNRMRRYVAEAKENPPSLYAPPFTDGDVFPLPDPPESTRVLL